jgi:hypothetical protein
MNSLHRFRQALLIVTVVLLGRAAHAVDLIPLYTKQGYEAIDGCCQSASPRGGAGGVLRLELGDWGTWDVFGMSDIKWNELALLRPVYLVGQPIRLDPTLDGSTSVKRIRRYSLLWAYGGGFFTHNTRTTQFDLATLVGGLTLVNHLEFQYSLSDRFSLVLMARAGIAFSLDDFGLIFAPLAGFLVRF